jgi:hypothetical protein
MKRRSLPLLLVLAGCSTRASIGLPPTVSEDYSEVALRGSSKMDLLFMIDNSTSMGPMQGELQVQFGHLLETLIGRGAAPFDLHLGVVTSDYGAGAVAGGGCSPSPGGQLGHLQAIGVAAPPTCRPPLGMPFVEYARNSDGSQRDNLPPGQDLAATFSCMTAVGALGCGFEHQLESVYAALHNNDVNAGFLRDDAQLTVVFVTNEDDGSAPPDSHIYDPPVDPHDPHSIEKYGAYDTYRQTRFGVTCGTPPALTPEGSSGLLSDCQPASNQWAQDFGKEYDVSRYVDFFTQPKVGGGVKPNPLDVVLISLAAPVTPFEVILASPESGNGMLPHPRYAPCSSISPITGVCVPRLQHSCQNATNPAFFGDPAVRLQTVVEKAAFHQVVSICGEDPNRSPDYTTAMRGMGSLMSARMLGGCLFAPPVKPARPDCDVSLVELDGPLELANCVDGSQPCWQVVRDARCPTVRDPLTGADEQLRLMVMGVAPEQTVHAACRAYRPL